MSDIWSAVVGDLQAWQVAVVLAAAFATGVFHTLSGFAGGLLLSIIIAPVLGVEAVIPVMAVALVISGVSRMWAFRADLDRAVYASILLPALPGIVGGALIYSRLAPWAVSVVLGVFLLLTVAIRRPLERRGVKVGKLGLGLVGSVFGLLSGVSIGAGMMLAPFLMGHGLYRERLAAQFAALGLVLNLSKTSVFVATAVLDQHLLLLGVAVGAATVPGNFLGYSMLKRTSIRIHTSFVEGLVLVAGIAFLWSGLSG